ncbi:hypothetical protein [Falsiroseomonas sp.]|uniref:hypothetical protein n=1 Tax=Falsiroseomonas sp. TaxID=2870721 RepID=UPI003F71F2BE
MSQTHHDTCVPAQAAIRLPDVLCRLAEDHGWCVAFRLDALRAFAGPEQIGAMFHLADAAAATLASADADVAYIALSAGRRHLVAADGAIAPLATQALPPEQPALPTGTSWSMTQALEDLPAAPDCLGVTWREGQPPTWLVLPRLASAGVARDVGLARALLPKAPGTRHYDLLPAIGLRHLGNEPQPGGGVAARFAHDTAVHLHAGLVSGYARTGHCNRFFVQGCEIDPVIEGGLKAAAAARIRQGRALAAAQLRQTILSLRQHPHAMTEVPPAPARTRPTGDQVALGLALWGLRGAEPAPENAAAAELAERSLRGPAPEGPFAFQSGGLPTATDSALVMLGMAPPPVACLAPFADPGGPGFLPQRTSATGGDGTMRAREVVDFWCQEDFPTTCLVRHLQRRAGLPGSTQLAHLQAWFPRRGGLFFASPFLTDLALALALQDDPAGRPLLDRLAAEVAAAQEPEGHFGRFAPATATAAAALVLGISGGHGRALLRAQIALLGLLDSSNRWPVEAPFHAASRATGEHPLPLLPQPGLRIGPHHLRVTLYEDTARAVVTALALRALGCQADPDETLAGLPPRHPRYESAGQLAYLGAHALPAYLVR